MAETSSSAPARTTAVAPAGLANGLRRRARIVWAIWEHPLGRVGVLLLGAMVTMAIFAPLIAPYSPFEQAGVPFAKPSAKNFLGTNDIGQDILSELIFGARVSLTIGALAAALAIGLGTFVGLVAGYKGGWIDAALMRLADVMLVIPFLPLMIVLAAYVGPSFWNLILVIGLLVWARPARIIRSQVLSLRTRGYVQAARSYGTSPSRIIWRHILPGVLPLALAQFVIAASSTILIEAALAFLGLGDPTRKSWGTILYYAQARGAFLTGAWKWWVLPPGFLITISVLGFAFTGYALEEFLNPRLKRG